MELLLPPYFDKRSYFLIGARRRPRMLARVLGVMLLVAVALVGFYVAGSLPDICLQDGGLVCGP